MGRRPKNSLQSLLGLVLILAYHLASVRAATTCTQYDAVTVLAVLPFSGSAQKAGVAQNGRNAWSVCTAMKNPDQAAAGLPRFDMLYQDAKDTQQDTLATAFTALSNASLTNLVAIMGPLISDQSLVVGYVSNVYKVPMFDLAQTGAISIERFPYFVRGRPSTATQALLWPVLLEVMGIRQVAVVADDNIYGDFYSSLVLQFTDAGIGVPPAVRIQPGLQPPQFFTDMWATIEKSTCRYVMLFLNDASHVFGTLAAGWVGGYLKPRPDPYVLLGLSAGLSSLNLLNARAASNILNNISNSDPVASIAASWAVGSFNVSVEDLLRAIDGTMVLYNAGPQSSATSQKYIDTRARVSPVNTTAYDPNVEGNIVDLCLTAYDAVNRASQAGLLCMETPSNQTGDTIIPFIRSANFQGVYGPVSYSVNGDMNVQQGILNLIYNKGQPPKYTSSLVFTFPVDSHNFTSGSHVFYAADRVTPLSDAQLVEILETKYVWGKDSAEPGIPWDGLVVESASSRDWVVIVAIVVPLGTITVLLVGLATYLTLSAPKPLAEVRLDEVKFDGVIAWLPTYALAEAVYRDFRAVVQVYARKGLFSRRPRESLTVLHVTETAATSARMAAALVASSQAQERSGVGGKTPLRGWGGRSGGGNTPGAHQGGGGGWGGGGGGSGGSGKAPQFGAAGAAAAPQSGEPGPVAILQRRRRGPGPEPVPEADADASGGTGSAYAAGGEDGAEGAGAGAAPRPPSQPPGREGDSAGSDSLDYAMVLKQLRDLVPEGRRTGAGQHVGGEGGAHMNGRSSQSATGQPRPAPGGPSGGVNFNGNGNGNGTGRHPGPSGSSLSAATGGNGGNVSGALGVGGHVLSLSAAPSATGSGLAATMGGGGAAARFSPTPMSMFNDLDPPSCSAIDDDEGTEAPGLSQAALGEMPMGPSGPGEPPLKLVLPRVHEIVQDPNQTQNASGGGGNGSPPGSARGRGAAAAAPPGAAFDAMSMDGGGSTVSSDTAPLNYREARDFFASRNARHFLLPSAGTKSLAWSDPEAWVRLLGSLRSSHVVMAIGCCRTTHEVLILREEMPGGSLSDLLSLRATTPLDAEGKMRVLSDVARGLSYLKCLTQPGAGKRGGGRPRWLEMILPGGSAPSGPLLRMMVHGRLMPSNVYLDKKLNAKLGIDLAQPLITLRELLTYSAPEVLKGQEPTAASDVYNFGILLYELFSGSQVFEGISNDEVLEGVRGGVLRPVLPRTLPSALGDIVLFCTASEPSHRPSIEELLHELERFYFYLELDAAMVIETD